MASWQSSAQGRDKLGLRLQKSRARRPASGLTARLMHIEVFEERAMLAIGPQLLAITPSASNILTAGETLHTAPTELTFHFNSNIDLTSLVHSGVANIQVIDGTTNVAVATGFFGVGDQPDQLVMRFANALPDHAYSIHIVGSGSSPLKGTSGQAFNGGVDFTQQFTLDLGPQVVAVDPQPVVQNFTTRALSQTTNEIDVYFNTDDPLDPHTAQTNTFYELIGTAGTATTQDDTMVNPTSVVYSATTGEAVLLFAGSAMSQAGTYRLRVGNNDPLPLAPTNPAGSGPAGSSFATADNLGTVLTASTGTQSLNVTGTIGATPISVIFPGGDNEPGTRNINVEDHLLGSPDTSGSIPVYDYNFQSNIGTVLGAPAYNVITATQEQRVREVLSYYSNYLGVEFVETASSGFTIATGDVRAVDPSVTPAGVGGIAGGSEAVMNSASNWGASESGGAYFQTAMHEIGHLLGLGHTYELPPLTIQGSAETQGSSVSAEPVFPGDADILLGQYLHPPDADAINIYQFALSQSGQLNLETFAERLSQLNSSQSPSELNTVITLFDGSGNIIARNDDYYGTDSFVAMQLNAGTYYAAVTSTGNTNFNPSIANSGAGGTTQGGYQLRMTFTPNNPNGIKNTNGTLLDGNGDGSPGGIYNFWFNVASTAQTIFVEKTPPATVTGAPGSITDPYTLIATAISAATQGSIIRIEGGAGNDNNPATLADNPAYTIGFDSLGNAFPDGSTLQIPKGVTVMVDAGAIIKLHNANIDVGSLSQGVDNSGGALQVLGTTAKDSTGRDIGSVYFTSFYNTAIGTDPDTAKLALAPGDWGGLVFHADADQEANGIFLDYVNHAQISYGGGQVSVNSVKATYDPIHLISSRPTISYNTISNSADAAVSADPNSFQESEFIGSTYETDYSRTGPTVHGNVVSNNSINGLFIRIRTDLVSGQVLDPLTVSARLTSTDMVYVLEENLEIQGQPGGYEWIDSVTGAISDPLDPNAVLTDRQHARLSIDPGVIMKIGGGRIETEIGSQFIAEGTSGDPIVFTSIFDDSYGAGGSFDTTNNGGTQVATAGDWGGLFFGPLSTASVDFAKIMYGGGSTSIEGGFATFDAVEIHQAKVRIADSILEFNAAGGDTSDRSGRTSATPAVIFVRGAQPVIINNVIENNDTADVNSNTAAISINVNALNSQLVTDPGRSTGPIDIEMPSLTNHGPLVRGNELSNNPLNGMLVRGGTITTDVVFDDTDIVHILEDEIITSNQFSLTGTVRLQSTSTESLVVKLLGATAGFTASGVPLDIPDRVGGAVQIIGTPSHPVVLTSLYDTTVGAGFTPTGVADNDTANQKGALTPAPTAGDWNGVKLDTYSNDTNIEVVNELEQGFTTAGDTNSTPATAQYLGVLAKDSKSGDDNSRLGFQVNGSISQTVTSPGGGDVDVYSFQGTAGTTVWFNINQSGSSLDSVVELVDSTGAVIARSDNAIAEQLNPSLLVGIAKPLQIGYAGGSGPFTAPNFFSTNPLDPGMRVDLPGTAGSINTYYIRVRASNPSPNMQNLSAGLTMGAYQLNIRLQNLAEYPGSVVRDVDIRYATIGVDVVGKPEHSPLEGDTAQTTNPNGTIQTAQNLGNLLSSSNSELSVAGNLTSSNQVAWFQFNLNYDLVQAISGFSDGLKTFAAMFAVNYADGLSRPDTTISVFDQNGNLILLGRDSDIPDAQPVPASGAGTTNLSQGSYGTLDPAIGTVQLPAGGPDPSGATAGLRTYYVAISSNNDLPTILDATFTANATNPLVRLEPIDSMARVVDDRIGSTSTTSTASPSQQIFPGTTPAQLDTSATPLNLADVVMYVNDGSGLFTVNPFTGQPESFITFGNGLPDVATGLESYDAMAMRSDGRLMTLVLGDGTNDTASTNGTYRQINTTDGTIATTDQGGLGDQVFPIATSHVDATGPITLNVYNFDATQSDPGVRYNAMTFGYDPFTPLLTGTLSITQSRALFAVGDRQAGNGITQNQNLLFNLNPDTGAAFKTNIEANQGFTPTQQIYQPFSNVGTAGAASGTSVIPNGTLTTGVNLIAIAATDPTNSANDIVDGQQFRIGNKVSETFAGVAASAGITFEFDSGPTLNFPTIGGANSTTPAANLVSGQSFKINGHTFEFTTNGNTTIAGATAITFTVNDSAATLGASIVSAVNGVFAGVASFGVHRVTFLSATADFTALPSATTGFTSAGASGTSNGATAIKFSAGETAAQMATSIANAINGANVPLPDGQAGNVVATTVASTTGAHYVQLQGGVIIGTFVFPEGWGLNGSDINLEPNVSQGAFNGQLNPLTTDSPASNVYFTSYTLGEFLLSNNVGNVNNSQFFLPQIGDITGIALVPTPNAPVSGAIEPDRMFAVSDSGAIYEVSNFDSQDAATMQLLNIVTDPAGGGLNHTVDFTGLTVGPPDVENGAFKTTLFATDINGNIWAIDAGSGSATLGQLKGVFLDGATHVATGLGGLQGVTFSSLDYNLWHATAGDATTAPANALPGHGVAASFDFNQARDFNVSTTGGGTSFYFGLENNPTQPQSVNYLPQSNGDGIKSGNPNLFASYNLPGGALGSLTANPFSLTGYTAADKPTLYFNYALDTQDASALGGGMRDSLRVMASTDGVNWTELATNNSVLSAQFQTNAELPSYASASGGLYEGDKSNQNVQQLFNQPGTPSTTLPATQLLGGDPNTTAVGWRQARIDLGDFAGKSNIMLRFDFSTAGSMGIGSPLQAGVYLGAPAGNLLQDGQSFVLDNTVQTGFQPNGFTPVYATSNVTFTFRQGFVLMAPVGGGATLSNGETFTVNGTTTYQIVKSGTAAAGNIAININNNMSANDVATAIENALTTNPTAGVTPHISGTLVQLVGATTVTQSASPALVLQGSAVPAPPAAGSLSADVPYTIDMTAAQVANAVATAMDAKFTALDNINAIAFDLQQYGVDVSANPPYIDDPNTFTSSKVVFGASPTGTSVPTGVLRLYGHNVVSAGPLAYSNTLPGDSNGQLFSPTTTTQTPIGDGQGHFRVETVTTFNNYGSDSRAQNNTHEGAYIDDIIVGFAGRGEMVTGLTNPLLDLNNANLNPLVPPAITGVATFMTLPADPDYNDPQRVSTGVFQLDIRPATSYAANGASNTAFITLSQTFDVNDRLSQSFTLTSLASSQIVDGSTFSLLTEAGTYTFEFVDSAHAPASGVLADTNIAVVMHQNDDAAAVALDIMNAINNVPNLSTALVPFAKNFTVKAGVFATSSRVNLFGSLADVHPGILGLLTFDNVGDPTPVRVQGETIIQDVRISNSKQYGIAVVPQVTLDSSGNPVMAGAPGHTGSLANLAALNASGLVPGISIKNNLIVNAGTAGILFSGTPSSDIAHAIPFGRIVNNTIVQSPIGIQVVNNASPTILNNIIAHYLPATGGSATGIGILVDGTSTTTVIDYNIYQDNAQNVVGAALGNHDIALVPGAALFKNPTNPTITNFYLAANSAAVDSSINSLPERAGLQSIDLPLGIPPSPIQAPDFDLLGQFRQAASGTSSGGTGSNVFKDRGAVELIDTVGPTAALVNPVDNNSADSNPALNRVSLIGQTLTSFVIQLNDSGTGVDDSTVAANKFVITRAITVGTTVTTTTLTPGADYSLAYDNTNKIVQIVPSQGVWQDATYTITLNNSTAPIKDLAGNSLQPNNANGTTQFVIQLAATATSSFQNIANRYDVNNDGLVTGFDALLIINDLLLGMAGPLTGSPGNPPIYVDVNGDGMLTAFDALLVINYLNNPTAQVVSHSVVVSAATVTPAVTTATPAVATVTSAVASATPAVNVVTPAATAATSSSVASAAVVASSASSLLVVPGASAIAFSISVGQSSASPAVASAGSTVTTSTTSAAISAPASSMASNAIASALATDEWDEPTTDLDSILNDLAGDPQGTRLVRSGTN